MQPNHRTHPRRAPQPAAQRMSLSAWLTFCALIAFCIFSLHTSERLTQGAGATSAAE